MDLRNVEQNKKRILEEAGNKTPRFGGAIPYEDYEFTEKGTSFVDAENPGRETKEQFETVGIDYNDDSRAGSFLYVDNTPSYDKTVLEGLEIMPLVDAVKKYDWMKNYYWKGIPPTLDMYTAKAYSEDVGGALIHSKAGQKVVAPMQTCMLINKNKNLQIGHTIIIAEENSSVNVISACSTNKNVTDAFHIEIVEMFAARNARIDFTMIHNWDTKSIVRPRGMVHLQEGAHFTNNYILLRPANDVQLGPTTFMWGPGCSASYQNVLASYETSKIDVGGTVKMAHANSRADLFTKSLSYGGEMTLRGAIEGKADNLFGNIDCKTLILNDKAIVRAIPEINTEYRNVEMLHEASVGRLDERKIDYLRTRGLTRQKAIQLLSSSFLMDSTKQLPVSIKAQIGGWIRDIDKYANN